MKILGLLACFLCFNAISETLLGKVIGVSDGDTLTVLVDQSPFKIRVAGIDAPEKAQPFGQRSKQSLSDCALGKLINVEWKKLDRYGRTIGKVISNDTDCGLRQIEVGLAWHYKAYLKEQSYMDQARYADAEQQARKAKTGIWSYAEPEAPWDFRHKK